MKQTTIAIIGAGAVGSTTAYALMLKDLAGTILLVDVNEIRCKGEFYDLADALPLSCTSVVRMATFKEASQADIIIIAAGAAQKPGQSRTELLAINHQVICSIMKELANPNPDAIIIMVTNPVDTLTLCAQELIKLPKNQIFGSGTLLDSQRLQGALSQYFHVAEESIHAYILGEHGDSQFVAWSLARIDGVPLSAVAEISEKERNRIAQETRQKAYDIIECKGFTSFGIATCVADICEAIIFDQKRVLPLSWYHPELQVCLSLPAILGARGIEKFLPIVLNEQEQTLLEKSAATLRAAKSCCA